MNELERFRYKRERVRSAELRLTKINEMLEYAQDRKQRLDKSVVKNVLDLERLRSLKGQAILTLREREMDSDAFEGMHANTISQLENKERKIGRNGTSPIQPEMPITFVVGGRKIRVPKKTT